MVLLKGRIALVEAMRTMIHAKNLPLRLWAESINTAAYNNQCVINRTRTSPQRPKTPYELWFGQTAKLGKLFPFGTTAYAHIPKEKRRKLDKKAEKGYFVGYNEDVKGFRIWFSETDRVDTKRDVIFKENDHSPAFSTENKKDDDLQTFRFLEEPAIEPQNYQPQEPEPQIFEKSEESIDEEESDGDDDWDSAKDPFDPEDREREEEDVQVRLQEGRVLRDRDRIRKPSKYNDGIDPDTVLLAEGKEPQSYQEAITSSHATQ